MKDDGIVHTAQLSSRIITRYRCLRWFPSHQAYHAINGAEAQNGASISQRLFVASDDDVDVYDMQDLQWHAEISGTSSNIGKIADVSFGWTSDEIVVVSDFGLKATLWSLRTGRGVEIKDPKSSIACYDLRPQTGHLAILTRSTTRDVVMVLTPFTHELEQSFTLATVDAQGLEWSPDGKWLATWDTSSAGFALYIYTPDGHLFKTYFGDQNLENPGLGICNIEWEPSGRYLAVGAHENRITLLYSNTVGTPSFLMCRLIVEQFTLAATLYHTPTINISSVPIWQEQIDSSRERSYTLASQFAYPPTSSDETGKLAGISHLAFNLDGTSLASRSDSNPSTVWIWNLRSLTLMTVLIHHHPVKSLQWHPTQPDLLLIHCSTDDPVIHLIGSDWPAPHILKIPLDKPGGKTEATWLLPPLQLSPTNQFSSSSTSTVIHNPNNNDITEHHDPHETYNTVTETNDTSPPPPLKLLFGNARNYIICRILRTGESPSDLTPRPQRPADPNFDFNFSTAGSENMSHEGNSMDLSPVKLSTDHFTRVVGGQGIISAEATWNGEMDDTFDFKR